MRGAAKRRPPARNSFRAKVNFDYTVVRAPFAGIVTEKAAQVGEIVSPLSAGGGFTRTGVGTIVDMDSLEVDVDVNEANLGQVKPECRQRPCWSPTRIGRFRRTYSRSCLLPTAARHG